MPNVMPVHKIITNIKACISINRASVLVNDEFFKQAEDSIKSRYENLIIVDEKEFSKERAHLRRFAKTLKEFYKTLEDEILLELRNNVYDKIYHLSGLAEQLAQDIADKEKVFILEKQENALSKVMDYIESLIGSEFFTDKQQVDIKPFYKNYSSGAFLRAKKDIDEQIQQLKQEYENNILQQQQQALQSQQEAKNYQYIVNYIDELNKKYGLEIDASQFYELRRLHLSDAVQEIDKYTEFLKLNADTQPHDTHSHDDKNSNPDNPDIMELLKAAQYILYSQHGLTVEPLEKAIALLKNKKTCIL